MFKLCIETTWCTIKTTRCKGCTLVRHLCISRNHQRRSQNHFKPTNSAFVIFSDIIAVWQTEQMGDQEIKSFTFMNHSNSSKIPFQKTRLVVSKGNWSKKRKKKKKKQHIMDMLWLKCWGRLGRSSKTM